MASTNAPSTTTLKIHQKLQEKDYDGTGWNELYAENLTPWNLGKAAPPLVELVQQGKILTVPDQRVLVPGCGEGNDAIFLASLNNVSTVYAVDISELAVKHMDENVSKRLSADLQKKVVTLQADFFTFQPDELFDVVFDYTFLCALPLRLRNAWAESMKRLVKKDGVLVTLMFPLGEYEGGPPFALSVDVYHHLLDDSFKIIHGPIESKETIPSRQGRELVAIFQKI